jgi:hypothetical protein
MAKPTGKRKAGRPAGTKATKRNKNSPPVNKWEMEHGVNVPQTGPTVFGDATRKEFHEILNMLCSRDSWDNSEPENRQDGQAVAILPESAEAEPWKYATKKWLWDWLARVGIGKQGLSFPFFFVRISSRAIRLHPTMQVQLEEFALSVLRFGTYTLRALVEKEPQGHELAPESFEPRNVSGQEALTGLAKMVESPEPDKKRRAFFEAAQLLRCKKYDDNRSRSGTDPFLTENEVSISFRELVKEHTGEEIDSLEITNKTHLELLRRYAREFSKARTFRIIF